MGATETPHKIRLTAAADGTWEIARELVVRLRGAKFTISAFTIDAAGQRSTPAMVEVSQ